MTRREKMEAKLRSAMGWYVDLDAWCRKMLMGLDNLLPNR
jgi:hypothetical protein